MMNFIGTATTPENQQKEAFQKALEALKINADQSDNETDAMASFSQEDQESNDLDIRYVWDSASHQVCIYFHTRISNQLEAWRHSGILKDPNNNTHETTSSTHVESLKIPLENIDQRYTVLWHTQQLLSPQGFKTHTCSLDSKNSFKRKLLQPANNSQLMLLIENEQLKLYFCTSTSFDHEEEQATIQRVKTALKIAQFTYGAAEEDFYNPGIARIIIDPSPAHTVSQTILQQFKTALEFCGLKTTTLVSPSERQKKALTDSLKIEARSRQCPIAIFTDVNCLLNTNGTTQNELVIKMYLFISSTNRAAFPLALEQFNRLTSSLNVVPPGTIERLKNHPENKPYKILLGNPQGKLSELNVGIQRAQGASWLTLQPTNQTVPEEYIRIHDNDPQPTSTAELSTQPQSTNSSSARSHIPHVFFRPSTEPTSSTHHLNRSAEGDSQPPSYAQSLRSTTSSANNPFETTEAPPQYSRLEDRSAETEGLLTNSSSTFHSTTANGDDPSSANSSPALKLKCCAIM